MSELQTQIDDLVSANHILFHHGVVDGYGHISFRSPVNPNGSSWLPRSRRAGSPHPISSNTISMETS